MQLSLFTGDNPAGVLRIDGGGHSMSLGLPAGVSSARAGVQPQIGEQGAFVDYPDFLTGGVGLRLFPGTDGFKTFLVLPGRPESNTFTLALDAPGLAVSPEDEFGNYVFLDEEGSIVGRLPRPFMLDSSVLEAEDGGSRGAGLFSDAVSQTVTQDGEGWLLTLTVDQEFLDQAVYPVYVDPTVTTFPTGSTTAADTFANSQAPNTNFNTYQRPDSPFYHEMWHGRTPDTSYYNELYIRFNDLEATLGAGHIDSAYLEMYPYWQFNHSEFKKSWIERVSEDWTAGSLKWNNRPDTDLSYGEFLSKQGVWTDWDVAAHVQDVVNGTAPNYGLMIHANSILNQGWKRFVSRNDSSNPQAQARRHVERLRRAHGVLPQQRHRRDIDTDTALDAARGIRPGRLRGPDRDRYGIHDGPGQLRDCPRGYSGALHPGYNCVNRRLYYWRVKVKYGNNTGFSGWSDTGSFTYRQGATLGLPGHNTFESFGLGFD